MCSHSNPKFIGTPTDAVYEGEDHLEVCKKEIMCFLKGGEAAVARLREVISSIFRYYRVHSMEEKGGVLKSCGLQPCLFGDGGVSFFFRGAECRDQFKAPYEVRRAWENRECQDDSAVDMSSFDHA
jgi:hypothetical protein